MRLQGNHLEPILPRDEVVVKHPANLDVGALIVAAIIIVTYFTLERAKFPNGKLPVRRTVIVVLATLGILVFVLLHYLLRI